MMATKLSKSGTIYDEPSATNKVRTASKWVKKNFQERNIWERLATIDIENKKCYEIQPKNQHVPPTHNIWLGHFWLTYTILPAVISTSSLALLCA
ncbi:unnamed protein product [Rotaria magnacalcarata]|uniref:Uncharacterized protein n=2 Tax=Rotaria magnacalcarata TaxID=392030 RepID=A0A8S2JG12_9BILA|nr:unnamed protein product [Rotaria magnacalcarata]